MKHWFAGVLLFLPLGFVLAADDPVFERMKKDVTFLASPECEGRGPGTKGIDLAADYIAKSFEASGLKPAGVKGTWFQPFEVAGNSKQTKPGQLVLEGPQGQSIELTPGRDFEVMGLSSSGDVTAPLVFAGYGMTSKEANYDDYKGLDVAGKIVVVLRHTPRWNSKDLPFPGKQEMASIDKKVGFAETHKAKGLILVNDLSEEGDKLPPFSYLVGAPASSIPAAHVKRDSLERVFQSARMASIADVERAIDRDLKPLSGPLTGWKARLVTGVKRETIPVKNVVAVVEGSGPLAKETVVVGAHYDHLGFGGKGSRSGKADQAIHHGADDNASGTTAVLELARRFASRKDRQGRRIVFMTFSAEEMGLLGSRHYCNKEPLFPLADTVAMVNLDMVGRMVDDSKEKGKGKLLVEGVGTGKGLEALVDKITPPNFNIIKKQGGTGPSDHDSFFRKNIPVLFFFTGTHPDYHKPSDTAEKINVQGMRQITDMAEKAISQLAGDMPRPVFVEVKGSMTPMASKGPRLGIVPNYEENVEGVLVGGVSDGGPAQKGGILAGDRIVQIAGKDVKNLNTYMILMAQQQVGQTIEVGVVRGDKKVQLKVELK